MLISSGGVLIRTRVRDIREMGRSTQGVTLINLDAGTRLAGVERIGETEEDANGAAIDGSEAGEGNGEPEAGNGGGEPV